LRWQGSFPSFAAQVLVENARTASSPKLQPTFLRTMAFISAHVPGLTDVRALTGAERLSTGRMA
jgi:hypothetical protein